MSFANLRKDESPPATTHACPPDLAGEASSGTLAIGPPAPTRGDGVPAEEQRQLILREYLMIHGKDHYEVLGVGRQASRSPDRACGRGQARQARPPRSPSLRHRPGLG